MSHTRDQAPVPLEPRRERVIHLLCQQVAADAMTLEEFERRVEEVHRAKSLAALDDIVRDLETPAAPTPERTAPRPADIDGRRESELMVAVMGGTSRKGHWQPARHTRIITLMGGAELDLREAELPNGTTEFFIITIMGGAEIIVPPGLAVECNGIGIMGGFDHQADLGRGAGTARPLLRISGIALMGGVEVSVRLPGETAADARRRIRDERRALQKKRRQLNGSDSCKEWWPR